MKHTPAFALATIVSALLCACGGDGGDDSPTTGGSITSANQTTVARTSLYAAGSVVQLVASGNTPTAAQPTSAIGHALAAGLRHAVAVAGRRTVQAVTTSDPEACANGGTVTTSFDDRDGNGTPSVGDVLTLVYAQCSDFSGESQTGTLATTLTSFTDEDHYAGTVSLQQFKVTQGGLTSTVTGSAGYTESDTQLEFDSTLVVGTGGLTVALASSAVTDTVTYASGFQIIVNAGMTQESIFINGSYTSSAMSGTFTVTTPQGLVNVYTDDGFSSGQVKVVGTADSALRVTAINATQYTLELDANGDGTYEGTQTVDQSTLRP